jgi:tetratricopeptide (TPR) repeat protein
MADVMRKSTSVLRYFLMLAAVVVISVDAKEKPKTSVADLRYGVALYHYYQQDYIAALAELMVADTRDGIQGHGDNPELIAGGVSLAFGMQHHAEAVFNQILQDERRPQSVRDAAWFYLGKLHYTRGDWVAAEQSFARVSSEFKPSLRAQMQALKINILIRNKNYADLALNNIDADELRAWSPYTFYNLGAAHARDGNFASAQKFFSELAEIDVVENPQRRKEQWALQDKAYTAIGYSYLAEKKYAAAIREFTKVRLDGVFANQALLGYGWAAVAQEEYDEALRPWQLLRSRSLMYPAVQESLLALPYAYEKLGAQGEAVNAYQAAEELLAREIQLIRDMRATLTEGELLTLIGSEPLSAEEAKKVLRPEAAQDGALTAVVTDDGQNWLKLDSTSIIKTRSVYLNELFAKNAFQTAVLDLRDLLRLQTLLQNWLPKLDAYRELLLQKQGNRERQEQQLAQHSTSLQEQKLQAERAAIARQLEQISSSENYMALADDETRALYVRIERGQQTIARMKAAGQDTSELETRAKMFGGILLWRAAQEYPARLAAQQTELKAIDASLAQIAMTRQHIEEITATSMDIQPTLARLQVLQKDVSMHLENTDQLIAQQSGLLRQQVDQQLAAHEKRLNNYLAQAHLAVARLYDAELRRQPE